MAEPIPAPPAERDTPGAYRPVSALAVAAFAVGVLFALLIVVLAAAGLLTGQPVLWKWPMVLGLAGAGLAGAAIWQVRASEGARTGGVLAGVALGLCVVFGLCYFAFQAADEFAVRAQTHEVAVDWFAKLSKGDVFEAFLWNLDAPAREAYRLPGDPPSAKEIADRNVGLERRFGRAELSALRDSDLLAVLRRAEGKYELEDLGVRDISYSPGGYRVSRDYRLHTPEGWFEIPLTLASAEGGDFVGGQRWQIQLSQGPILGVRS
jgi:hypothetical protein